MAGNRVQEMTDVLRRLTGGEDPARVKQEAEELVRSITPQELSLAEQQLIHANVGLNVVFHNTQWVVSLHAHTFLLTGLGSLLFAVIYALLPMLTDLEVRSQPLAKVHFWCWMIGSVVMAYAMGMAGAKGMLRRMLYPAPNAFTPYLAVALGGAIVMAAGFIAFLANIVSTLGWTNVLSLVVPERWLERRLEAEAAAA